VLPPEPGRLVFAGSTLLAGSLFPKRTSYGVS
jgi:hypothetical protein